MERPIAAWPAFVCEAIDERTGRVCGLAATWMRRPIARSRTYWTYCDRHFPAASEPIPADVSFAVTRLELRVALAGPPGDLEASADEAVRRAVFALEAAGGTVVQLRVVGQKASIVSGEGARMRLQLAGRPKPLPDRRSSPTEAPGGPGWWPRRWWRTG